jgi:branched-chain amino acid transport system permease protein
MTEIFGISIPALMGQLTVGLVNGSFYAMLSMGLAVVFGLLGIVNFAHGALYMLGALLTWMMLRYVGLSYWWALAISPVVIALLGAVLERTIIRRIYDLDHVYGMLLTYGLALVVTSIVRFFYGSAGLGYEAPDELSGVINLGFMFLPLYRAWVIAFSLATCFATWFIIDRTRLGSYLRAATENPKLTQAFGVNVPFLVTMTFSFGAGLAALGGVLAAPIQQVNPLMGDLIIISVFAVVVIGGFGSIAGAIVTGLSLGLVEGLTKYFYAPASNTIVFVVMILILAVKPYGLFGKPK